MDDCSIRISLPDKDIPFLWLNVSLDCDLINKFTTEAKQSACQYLSTVGLSPHSWGCNYKVAAEDMWTYLWLFIFDRKNRRPAI